MSAHDPGTVDVYGQWVRAGRRRQGEPDPSLPSLFDRPSPEAVAPAFTVVPDALSDPSEPVTAPVGRWHPETAVEAAHVVRHKASSQRARLLDALAVAVFGLTAAEATEIVGSSRNQIGARFSELREMGWAQRASDEDGKLVTRATDVEGKYSGAVHILTDEGRAQWRKTRSGGA